MCDTSVFYVFRGMGQKVLLQIAVALVNLVIIAVLSLLKENKKRGIECICKIAFIVCSSSSYKN